MPDKTDIERVRERVEKLVRSANRAIAGPANRKNHVQFHEQNKTCFKYVLRIIDEEIGRGKRNL
jgi:hypothetical protein